MTDDIEWSPWIDHDGKGFPYEISNDFSNRGYAKIQRRLEAGRMYTPREQANPGENDPNHPGWKWKRSGLFGWGPWVASDPEYGRIVRYRFGKPRQKSAQVEMLREIVEGKAEPKEVDA